MTWVSAHAPSHLARAGMIQACGSHGGPSTSRSDVNANGSASWFGNPKPSEHRHEARQERHERPDHYYLSSRDAFSRRAFRCRNHQGGPGNHSQCQAAPSDVKVQGIPAAVPVAQHSRRLPTPTASAREQTGCPRVGRELPSRPAFADSESPVRVPSSAALMRSPVPGLSGEGGGRGLTTTEASRRVQQALQKLDLPEWFLQYYRPPAPRRGDASARLIAGGGWPKWRAPPAGEGTRRGQVQAAANPLPADRRNLVIPKRVTFREKGSPRAKPWVYRSLRAPYLGWRYAGPGSAPQEAAVR